MDETQREVLRAIADTVVPSIERGDDPNGFWARAGSSVGADEAVAEAIAQMPEPQREGLGQLAGGLARMGFLSASQRSREQLLRNLAALGPEAAAGAQALVGLSLFFAYSLPDPSTGLSPFWAEFGYPGPGAPPDPLPKVASALVPEGDEAEYEADAVVVGSGAGGGLRAKRRQVAQQLLARALGGRQEAHLREPAGELAEALALKVGHLSDRLGDRLVGAELAARASPEAVRVIGALDARDHRVGNRTQDRPLELVHRLRLSGFKPPAEG